MSVPTSSTADVVVIGAGVVGASCAFHAARAGLRVTIVDRGPVAGGTTGAGEGNLLVSDKPPGAELDLARRSARLWREIADEVGGFEYEPKGGIVVAASESALADLHETSAGQCAAGVDAVPVSGATLHEYEPHLAPGLRGGIYYPEDAQVQPMLAAARLLADAREHGAQMLLGHEVRSLLRDGERVVG
ncbi:MAG: NAD(P)/FAD-dependent oxidoreductase, partial [Nocardioidaceae bacterium]